MIIVIRVTIQVITVIALRTMIHRFSFVDVAPWALLGMVS